METSRRLIIMLVVAVVLAFGVIALRGMAPSEPLPAVVEQKIVRILIAKRDIPQGTVIQPLSDLDWKELPASESASSSLQAEGETTTAENATTGSDVPKGDYLHEGEVRMEDFAGAIVRRPLYAGDNITSDALTRAGAGGVMSAVLESGMRAVSIAVNPTSGNAGFVSPGDRIDLIVTHRVHPGGAGSNTGGLVVSETFVHNVRVIAVDQQIDNPENKAVLAKTITVEVTPRQAEQVAVAADLGKVSLVLRSLASDETDKAERSGYTSDRNVSGALGAGGIASTVRIIRGDQVEDVAVH
jgi:pilus assembly protein CpaB